MPGKASKARYKAMLEDVKRRVWYAFSTGKLDNPYPVDDKRHDRFRRELHATQAMDSLMEDMHEAHGCDTSTWSRRVHPWPGPVRPLAELV